MGNCILKKKKEIQTLTPIDNNCQPLTPINNTCQPVFGSFEVDKLELETAKKEIEKKLQEIEETQQTKEFKELCQLALDELYCKMKNCKGSYGNFEIKKIIYDIKTLNIYMSNNEHIDKSAAYDLTCEELIKLSKWCRNISSYDESYKTRDAIREKIGEIKKSRIENVIKEN